MQIKPWSGDLLALTIDAERASANLKSIFEHVQRVTTTSDITNVEIRSLLSNYLVVVEANIAIIHEKTLKIRDALERLQTG